MLDFAIFAVTFVVGLILLLVYIYPSGKSKPSTVPGPEPSDEREGNLPDIARAGSLHQYLTELHDKYGDIASFWWGQTFVVTICSPDLFKQHSHFFNRPVELFLMFEPLVTKHSIQFANDGDGRKRRQVYDVNFTSDMIKHYYSMVTQAAVQLTDKWSTFTSDEHIPLSQYMMAFALRSAILSLFGGFFLENESEILEFKRHYDICWEEMESLLKGSFPVPGDNRQEAFDKNKAEMFAVIQKAISHRRSHPPSSPQDEVLLDTLISSGFTENVVLADSVTYVIGSFHTTGNLMTWCLYYLAMHPEVQEKVYNEVVAVSGQDVDLSPEDIHDMSYCRQVIDETLRCSTLAPWAARYSDSDIKLDDHVIPGKTPVIHALGVSLYNPDVWKDPDQFNPDRFSPEQDKHRQSFAFRPFGFAGKRICPGYRFAYLEAHILLATVVRKFKLHLIEGQVVEKVHGLVTHPEEEIWIYLEKRM